MNKALARRFFIEASMKHDGIKVKRCKDGIWFQKSIKNICNSILGLIILTLHPISDAASANYPEIFSRSAYFYNVFYVDVYAAVVSINFFFLH